MAATLANGGVNPLTKTEVIDAQNVPGILAVMATAGLYDDAGKWLFHTGLPAKSGVGGGRDRRISLQTDVVADPTHRLRDRLGIVPGQVLRHRLRVELAARLAQPARQALRPSSTASGIEIAVIIPKVKR